MSTGTETRSGGAAEAVVWDALLVSLNNPSWSLQSPYCLVVMVKGGALIPQDGTSAASLPMRKGLEGPRTQVPGLSGECDAGTCVSGREKVLAGGGVFSTAPGQA